jgi:hypothetical protein
MMVATRQPVAFSAALTMLFSPWLGRELAPIDPTMKEARLGVVEEIGRSSARLTVNSDLVLLTFVPCDIVRSIIARAVLWPDRKHRCQQPHRCRSRSLLK